MIGQSVPRKEDERLLTGKGVYFEDVQLPGMLHVAFLRSPHAHATVRSLLCDGALALPGVVAVATPDNWPEFAQSMPELIEPGTLNNPYCDFNQPPPRALLPREANYVGEQLAAVVAETAFGALDGIEAIEVDYGQLAVVPTWSAAVEPGAPRVHPDQDNIVAHLKFELGDIESALRAADLVLEERIETQSLKSMAIECRGVTACWDPLTQVLNIWSTSQLYYLVRDSVAKMLGLGPDQVRVMARDVGGGFGLKGILYPEDIIVPVLAYRLKRPLRWTETRTEHMVAANHSGIQTHDVRVGVRRDGTIVALDIKIHKDVGAFNHFEMVCPTNTVNHLPTQYRIPSFRAEAWSVTTNKSPVTPYRGAGRLEAVFTMDRILDLIARGTRVDPLDVRMRNIIPKEAMPYRNGLIYRDGIPITYDGGDYPLMLKHATERADYDGWRRRQPELRKEGRSIGIGISSYVEAGGIGPCEGSTVRIAEDGRVSVRIGVNSQGQGHETTFAQVCAHHLGARFEDVEVRGGDTNLLASGFGTAASRVGVNTGNAVMKTTLEVRRKVLKLAGHLLECDERDIELHNGMASVVGASQLAISFAELAAAAGRSGVMAELGGPGLMATEYFYPRTVTWASGVHVAVVELDRETGRVKILKYVVAHDSGVPLNPMIVDGQIFGGIAQGLGAALCEEAVYDAQGQVLTGSMMDYAVMHADDMPEIEVEHFVFPTEENPLGMRSVGESGPISPPAALAAAVEDAIGGGVRITRLPLTGPYILELVRHARR